jgi:hypothetical protein
MHAALEQAQMHRRAPTSKGAAKKQPPSRKYSFVDNSNLWQGVDAEEDDGGGSGGSMSAGGAVDYLKSLLQLGLLVRHKLGAVEVMRLTAPGAGSVVSLPLMFAPMRMKCKMHNRELRSQQ